MHLKRKNGLSVCDYTPVIIITSYPNQLLEKRLNLETEKQTVLIKWFSVFFLQHNYKVDHHCLISNFLFMYYQMLYFKMFQNMLNLKKIHKMLSKMLKNHWTKPSYGRVDSHGLTVCMTLSTLYFLILYLETHVLLYCFFCLCK